MIRRHLHLHTHTMLGRSAGLWAELADTWLYMKGEGHCEETDWLLFQQNFSV